MIDPSKLITIDIETDNLLPKVSKIHVICTKTSISNSTAVWNDGPVVHNTSGAYKGSLQDCMYYLDTCVKDGYTLVFHNGIGYDHPVLEKFLKDVPSQRYIVDTMILSQKLHPERPSHSLDSWGQDFGVPKPKHEDWSKLSKEMIHRCIEDVRITEILLKKLTTSENFIGNMPYAYDALMLEQEVMRVHTKQVAYGVRYNVEAATRLYHSLSFKREQLGQEILKGTPWHSMIPNLAKKNQEKYKEIHFLRVGKIPTSINYRDLLFQEAKAPFKKDGHYNVATLRYFGNDPDTGYKKVLGAYTKVEFLPMNLNSSDEVKTFLQTLGWVPTEWNTKFEDGRKHKTSPKLTEDSYVSLPDGLGRQIADYNILKHRCNLLFNPDSKGRKEYHKGALAVVVKRGDGRVSAEAITLGTPTARYRHAGVVCNLPSGRSPYGAEIRSLFCCGKGHLLIGVDLAQLEARILAHYILPFPGGRELADVILDGDIHQHNADAWGVSRGSAKGGMYAINYGCYPKKLAETLGKPISEAELLFDIYWKTNAPVKLLTEALEKEYDHNGGKIRGLDGRWIFVRDKRKLLNTLIQSAGSVIFKYWMILVDKDIISAYSILHQVLAYHDELLVEVEQEDLAFATEIKNAICLAAEQTGKELGVKVPITADGKVGTNYYEVH